MSIVSFTTFTAHKNELLIGCKQLKQSKQRRLYARYQNYLYIHFTFKIPREPSSLLECLQCSFCDRFRLTNERHVCEPRIWPRILVFILQNTPHGCADDAWSWMIVNGWFMNCFSFRMHAHGMALRHKRRDFSKLFATWGQCDTTRSNNADEILEIAEYAPISVLTYPKPTILHFTYFHYLATLRFHDEQTNRRLEQLLWKRCGLGMDDVDIVFSPSDSMTSICDTLLLDYSVPESRRDSFIFAFTASQEYLINAEKFVKEALLINLQIPGDLYKIIARYHIDWHIRTIQSEKIIKNLCKRRIVYNGSDIISIWQGRGSKE